MTNPLLSRLRLPVVVAPMFLVSGPEMVISAARSGLVGAFPTPNCRTAQQLDEWMTQIVAETRDSDGLWAANLVTHSTNDRLADDLALVAKHKPPIVITALGRKAAAAGADGLVAVSSGAGGHTGQLSPFAFVSAIREFFDGIVCVGGGISDGAGVAGAVAAGADLVYMGTRFLAAEESMAVDDYKDMVVSSDATDLIVSAGVTGTPASWLIPSLLANGYDLDDLTKPATRNYGGDDVGTRWKDLWAAGQGIQAVKGREPVAAIGDQLDAEFRAAKARLAAIGG